MSDLYLFLSCSGAHLTRKLGFFVFSIHFIIIQFSKAPNLCWTLQQPSVFTKVWILFTLLSLGSYWGRLQRLADPGEQSYSRLWWLMKKPNVHLGNPECKDKVGWWWWWWWWWWCWWWCSPGGPGVQRQTRPQSRRPLGSVLLILKLPPGNDPFRRSWGQNHIWKIIENTNHLQGTFIEVMVMVDKVY